MRWWRWAAHPAVLTAGGPWGVFKQAMLAWRLFRDERVPLLARMMVPAMVLYVVSPVDLAPDLFPLIGQLDDVALVVFGLMAFVRLCPAQLVAEHQARLDGHEPAPERETPRRETPRRETPRTDGEPIDARYQWVDGRRR